MFATSLVPLQLCFEDRENNSQTIVWKNPRCNSTNYCRPVSLSFHKETTEYTLQEVNNMNEQIKNLVPTKIDVNGIEAEVCHDFKMTMIDGKVCNAVTGTKSTQSCNVCGASPKNINDIDAVLLRPVNANALSYGLSTLHAWIRFFEFFLHLAYRYNIEEWQVLNLLAYK